MSTYAILAQLMEDMLYLQPTEIRQVTMAERNRRHHGQMTTGRGSITQFIGVWSLCHYSPGIAQAAGVCLDFAAF